MNPTIKQQWLIALRSSVYRQGRGHLHIDDAFCSMGLLCELHRQQHAIALPDMQWYPSPRVRTSGQTAMAYLGKDSLLPTAVWQWADIPNPAHWDVLAYRNDRGDTFSELADYIEQNL